MDGAGFPQNQTLRQGFESKEFTLQLITDKRAGNHTVMEKEAMRFPLWVTRPPPCREPLGDRVEQASELSHLRAKSWGRICQSFPVAGWGLVEGGVVIPRQACPLAKHPLAREHLWMERAGAYNRRHCLYHEREWWLPGGEVGLQLCLLLQGVPFQPH